MHVDDSGLRDSEPEPFLKTAHDERQLRFSHDGRWVTYASDESGDQLEIYVRAVPDDGRRWQISDGGGSVSQWSSRPPYVLFQAFNQLLMLAPYHVRRAAFAPGEPRRWSTSRMANHSGPGVFSVSRDGTRVAALVPDAVSADRSRHVVTLWTDFLDAAGLLRLASAASKATYASKATTVPSADRAARHGYVSAGVDGAPRGHDDVALG